MTNDIRHGFVYERVQHITLKSIANNSDIKEGMSRKEIDEAIKRHADIEMLYDKPYEDKKEVRGTGADGPNFDQSILDLVRERRHLRGLVDPSYRGASLRRHGGRAVHAHASGDRDRPAVRHRQPVVRQERRP